MLGEVAADLARPRRRPGRGRRRARPDATPRVSRPRRSAPGTKLQDVSFDLYPGEVLGVVALEGQGQDELFDILAGLRPAERRRAPRRRRAGRRSAIPPTRSGPASSTSRPTAPRPC